ncbi:MAG: glycyl-radical enzyme activating protein [Desulfobacteraceae bacterium]|nr:glycyl-radical enzyme activating protein [Desulfobacteraceae bacterium]
MTDTKQSTQKGYIFKIQKYCLHDGPGIRTTIFFQGCPLKCQWCHNPESQSFADKTDKNKINQNKIGQTDTYSVSKLIYEIEKDRIFYDQSQGGVTFSGGEPLSQPDFLLDIIKECEKKAIHTCLDTSGYASLNVFKEICQKIDMVLFDLKFIDNNMHKQFTNVPLKPVLDSLKFASKNNIAVTIRIPLIPDITDTNDNINGIIFFLTSLKKFKDISLLPFHNTGEGKYETLGMKNHLKGLKPCSTTKINKIKQKFKDNGFNVTIGG